MKNRTRISLLVISLLSVLALAALYLIAFHCLGKDLKSLFDEGFFYLGLKSRESFTVFTQPLSLGNELLSAIWPDLGQRDILALRKLAYLSKLTGLLILSVSAFFFFRRERRSLSVDSGLLLVSCIFLSGLYIIPSIVININDELVFLEMIVLALCFFALGTEKKWLKGVLSGLVGVFSFLAILCNAPGGIMLYLLSVLFICLYPGWRQSGAGWVIPASILGLMVGLGVMHFFVIRVPDFIAFLQTGIAQTSGGYAAAHHSLSRLLVSILLNIRNLILTVVSLLGITFVAGWVKRFTKKDFLAILAGLLLFVIYYKWQVKPGVGIANIMTWLLLMTFLVFYDKAQWQRKDIILLLVLYLMPLALSLGSNSGFLFKAMTVIVPWGIMSFFLVDKVKESSPVYSIALYLFVFALIMLVPGRYFLNCLHRDAHGFSKEYPVARMQLTQAQSDFFSEVYDVLGRYGYQSRRDTVLAFCFNEMTLVAVDAVPYTNDQHPEEFLTHDLSGLPRPAFMILSEWDEKKLPSRLQETGWGFPEDYDVFRLKTNPDPGSGYEHTMSSIYCLKERKLPCSSTQ